MDLGPKAEMREIRTSGLMSGIWKRNGLIVTAPDLDSAATSLPPLSDVARLSLSIGRLFMESGESGRVIHEEICGAACALGCDSAEVYCQHAAIILTLRRGEEFCVQMGKVGEHGVNLRRSEAIRDTLRRVATGDLECSLGVGRCLFSRFRTPDPSGWNIGRKRK